MANFRQLHLKVIRDGQIKWIHYCDIEEKLYLEFFRVTQCERSEFGAYLSVWARADFGVDLTMGTYSDAKHLKRLVAEKYRKEYSELYMLKKEENPVIKGWFRMWVSQHMRVEVAGRGGKLE